LATLRRKIEARFYEKKVSPGRPVYQFIAELDKTLQNLHDIPIKSNPRARFNQTKSQSQSYALDTSEDMIILSQPQLVRSSSKKNYGRLVKRLTHKFRLSNVILRKTDKSKAFHLGRLEDYRNRSKEYMDKTKAYQFLGTNDPLPDLVQRTNKYLLDLRLAKWITQKQYELLCINPNEIELAHLYYLPKAHKPGVTNFGTMFFISLLTNGEHICL